jgi:hypothetical protein
MLTKHILAISLSLPLLAMSATAQAGPTITDKNYWPNEARQGARIVPRGSPGDFNSAFAYDRAESRFEPATNPYGGGSAWRYQGGPKSR